MLYSPCITSVCSGKHYCMVLYNFCRGKILTKLTIFKPGSCQPQVGVFLVSWNCFCSCIGMCVYVRVCLSVCVFTPRPLITSGMMWRATDHVWLVKQILWLFQLFSCFIWHLPSIKWMSMALVTQGLMNASQED